MTVKLYPWLQDIKCSGNWMWPAKLPGEGAALVDACKAMCEAMTSLGIAVDGGKDSLSMAARVRDRTVKAPGRIKESRFTEISKNINLINEMASSVVCLIIDIWQTLIH